MSQKINLTKHIIAAGVLIISAMAFVSCEKYVWEPVKIDTSVPVSFKDEVAPIFTTNCKTCHTEFKTAISSYKFLVVDNNFVNVNNPESSIVYQRIVSGHNSSGVTDIQKQKLLAWITQGALDN